MTAIVQALGFDSFAYALTTSNRPDKEAQVFVYTTMPAEWMMIYDQKAYCEVDPRMQLVARSTMPILWEQRDFRGKSSRQDEFLNDAAKYGTLSGLIYALYDISHGDSSRYSTQKSQLSTRRAINSFSAISLTCWPLATTFTNGL